MKIKAEKWIFEGERSYKVINSEKCCDKILDSKVVVLNDEYENGDDTDYSLKLVNEYYTYDIEGYSSYEPIKYCPFCSSKIDIEIVRSIDKTEEYIEIRQKRVELWNEHNKTDSKKKAQELREEIRLLDEEINNLHYSDGIEDLK